MQEQVLPRGWEWKKLGDVTLKFINGGTPSTAIPEYWNGSIPWTTSKSIISCTIKTGEKFISQTGVEKSSANVIPKENVLIASRVGIGKSAVNLIDIAISQDLTGIILDKNRILPEFLVRYLHNPKILQFLESNARGSTIKGLQRSDLERIEIPLPPLPIQRQIVAELELAEAVKRRRQEADTLTGGLSQNVFFEMFGDPVRNEKRWDRSKLGDCCRIQRGKFTNRPRNEPRFYGGNYPFIQTGDIANCEGKLKKFTQTLNNEGLSISKMFPKETIVISIAGNIGDTAILDFDSCFPDSVVAIIPDNRKGNIEFFEMMLRFYKEYLWNFAPETAQRNINLKILSELEIIIPPLPLQQKFAHIVKHIETLREKQRVSEREIKGLYEGLIQTVFNGELNKK